MLAIVGGVPLASLVLGTLLRPLEPSAGVEPAVTTPATRQTRNLVLQVMQSLATVQFEHGDMTAARETVDRCSERAALAGDVRVGAIVDVLRARITLEEGDAEGALHLAEAAGQRLEEIGDHRQHADALRVAAAANHQRSEYAESDRAYRRAIEILASIKDHPDLSTLAAEYAQKLRARGDLESAFAYLELARDPAASRPGS